MKVENLEVIKIGKVSDKVAKEVLNQIIISEDEQTILHGAYIYEISANYTDNELYIHKYSKNEYGAKYGEGTLLDLLEAYEG